jgi:hypothetical protein
LIYNFCLAISLGIYYYKKFDLDANNLIRLIPENTNKLGTTIRDNTIRNIIIAVDIDQK